MFEASATDVEAAGYVQSPSAAWSRRQPQEPADRRRLRRPDPGRDPGADMGRPAAASEVVVERGRGMSTRSCPDWPELLDRAPDLNFKHYTADELQLAADIVVASGPVSACPRSRSAPTRSATSSTPTTPTPVWPTRSAAATGRSSTPGRGNPDPRKRSLTPRDGGYAVLQMVPISLVGVGNHLWGDVNESRKAHAGAFGSAGDEGGCGARSRSDRDPASAGLVFPHPESGPERRRARTSRRCLTGT